MDTGRRGLGVSVKRLFPGLQPEPDNCLVDNNVSEGLR
jgi:hypothetical protein